VGAHDPAAGRRELTARPADPQPSPSAISAPREKEKEVMTTVTVDQRTKARDIICDILEIDTGEITETSLFIEDHDADSMRLIEILSGLEMAFGVTIPQSEIPRMVNLASVYDVLGEAK
jgi:acyl carrier protein